MCQTGAVHSGTTTQPRRSPEVSGPRPEGLSGHSFSSESRTAMLEDASRQDPQGRRALRSVTPTPSALPPAHEPAAPQNTVAPAPRAETAETKTPAVTPKVQVAPVPVQPQGPVAPAAKGSESSQPSKLAASPATPSARNRPEGFRMSSSSSRRRAFPPSRSAQRPAEQRPAEESIDRSPPAQPLPPLTRPALQPERTIINLGSGRRKQDKPAAPVEIDRAKALPAVKLILEQTAVDERRATQRGGCYSDNDLANRVGRAHKVLFGHEGGGSLETRSERILSELLPTVGRNRDAILRWVDQSLPSRIRDIAKRIVSGGVEG